jgi:hypothetical protein
VRCLFFGFYLEFGGVGRLDFEIDRETEKQRETEESEFLNGNDDSSLHSGRNYSTFFIILRSLSLSLSLSLYLCFLYVFFSMHVLYMKICVTSVQTEVIVLMILFKFDVDESDDEKNRSASGLNACL